MKPIATKASDFLGLTKLGAQGKAEACYMIFRLVSIDGEKFLGYPPVGDVCADRICVEITNGVVSSAKFF